MYAYWIGALRFSEDVACKRIQAARLARRFPAMLDAVAEGALHLSGLLLLGPYLNPGNADVLLRAAAGKSRAEIEALLAQRFPRSELLPMVQALPAPAAETNLVSAQGRISRHVSETGLRPEPRATAT